MLDVMKMELEGLRALTGQSLSDACGEIRERLLELEPELFDFIRSIPTRLVDEDRRAAVIQAFNNMSDAEVVIAWLEMFHPDKNTLLLRDNKQFQKLAMKLLVQRVLQCFGAPKHKCTTNT